MFHVGTAALGCPVERSSTRFQTGGGKPAGLPLILYLSNLAIAKSNSAVSNY
jgi:hypothetical protein